VARRLAEDHVGRPDGWVAFGTDDEIGNAITIHITRATDRKAGNGYLRGFIDLKAVCGRQLRQIQVGHKPTRFAKHDVRRAGISLRPSDVEGADDDIIEPVAIDIAGTTDGETGRDIARAAAELEAIGAIERGQVELGG